MTPKEALQEAVRIVGGQKELGRHTGYTQSAISQWIHIQEQAPAEAITDIEVATQGKITRRLLRPDLYAPVKHRRRRKSQ